MLQNKLQKEEQLFLDGIIEFNNGKYYDAHEIWEELWNDYPLKDPLFIQGLIQVSVAYFHIINLNLKGSLSLFNKSLPKLKKFPSNHRNLNLSEFIFAIESSKENISKIEVSKDFNWALAPKIIINS